jgi:CxxC-x17-CxxC domain-containing protein
MDIMARTREGSSTPRFSKEENSGKSRGKSRGRNDDSPRRSQKGGSGRDSGSGRFSRDSGSRGGSGRFSRDSGSRGGSGRFSRDSGSRGGSGRFSRDSGSRGGFGRDSGRSRPAERRNREAPVMHEVTCDKCHRQCEVPFLPSSDKPVYCSDCFRKEGGDSKVDKFEDAMRDINKKLDKIIKALDI